MTARLTCPEGTGGGDVLRIARGGRAYDVTVPEGVVAGQTFQVQLPAVLTAGVPTLIVAMLICCLLWLYCGFTAAIPSHTFQAQLPAVAAAAEGSAEGSPEGSPAAGEGARAAAGGTGYGALMNSNSDPLITCTGV